MKLLAQTAEATLYTTDYLGLPTVLKKRSPKKYRAKELDTKLSEIRLTVEAGIIHRAKQSGVRTPVLYKIDKVNASIWMEFFPGKKLDAHLSEGKGSNYCTTVGKHVAKLHARNIIHGDLTSSNILVSGKEVCLIDFGLGFNSAKAEDKAVDLLNFKKSLLAKYKQGAKYWTAFVKTYSKQAGKSGGLALRTLDKVETRVRYAH